MPDHDVLGLSLTISPIDRVLSGDSVECVSSYFLVASDDSDGDTGLLASLLGPSSFDSVSRASVSSEFSLYSAVDSPARLPQAGWVSEPCSVLAFGLGGPVSVGASSIGRRGVSRRGCAYRSITYRSSNFGQPSGKYGLPLHHPHFWNGLTPRNRFNY